MAIIAFLLSACGGNNSPSSEPSPTPTPTPAAPTINIADTENTNPIIAQNGGVAKISFTANGDWTASSADAWCNVTPESGKSGSFTITIETEENKSFEERSTTVTIKNGTASKTIIVKQESDGIITFEDLNVKDICVLNWDINSDGELSFSEAAKIKIIGEVFKNNSSIYSFDEFQYFTGLSLIDEYAFAGCSNLKKIVFPEDLLEIGNCAFKECSNLTDIILSKGLNIIGNASFLDCCNLESIDIPENVIKIGYSAFRNCSLLKSIKLPNCIISIGSYCFSDCYNLTEINLPNSLTSIEEGLFYKCSSIISIDIPERVTSIGVAAFNECI